jgi:hypothetical protein
MPPYGEAIVKCLADVTTSVALKLGDSTHGIWPLSELERYVKDAYAMLCRESLAIWKQRYLNDQANVSDYGLPSDLIQIDRATWDAKPVEPTSEGHANDLDDQYKNDSQPGSRPLSWFTDGLNTLRKYPPPSVSASNSDPTHPTTDVVNNFRIEYFAYGASLATGITPFELPDSWTKAMVCYVLQKCYDRMGPGHSIKLAAHFKARWDSYLAYFVNYRWLIGSIRTGSIGAEGPRRRSGPPAPPKMPWPYGKIVRG